MAVRRSRLSGCWLAHHNKTKGITLGRAPVPLGCAWVDSPVATSPARARPDLQELQLATLSVGQAARCPIAGSFEWLRNGSLSRVLKWV